MNYEKNNGRVCCVESKRIFEQIMMIKIKAKGKRKWIIKGEHKFENYNNFLEATKLATEVNLKGITHVKVDSPRENQRIYNKTSKITTKI